MRATKLVMTVKHPSYKERLVRLSYTYLLTLKYRRIRGDMIEVYKILTDKYDNNVNIHLERQKDSITRGHSLKLDHPRCRYDLRKYSFTVKPGTHEKQCCATLFLVCSRLKNCQLMEQSARECHISQ